MKLRFLTSIIPFREHDFEVRGKVGLSLIVHIGRRHRRAVGFGDCVRAGEKYARLRGKGSELLAGEQAQRFGQDYLFPNGSSAALKKSRAQAAQRNREGNSKRQVCLLTWRDTRTENIEWSAVELQCTTARLSLPGFI